MQNVFIKISQHAASLSDEQKIKSWVYAITHNAIIDYYRTRPAHLSTQLSEHLSDRLEIQTDSDIFHGLDECIVYFIEQLPEEYREIVRESETKER